MLKYNLNRIIKTRMVQQPVGYLKQHGFPKQTAQRLLSGRFKILTTKQMEKLCLAFNCTPNDLIEWTQDDEKLLQQKPALQQLIRSEEPFGLTDIAKEIPFNKLKNFTREIEEIKKRYTE